MRIANHYLPRLLESFQSLRINFFDVLSKRDHLLRAVRVRLVLSEDSGDLGVEILSAVSHVHDLESLLDGDLASEGFVVHEELDQVEQLAQLEASDVADDSLVHGHVLLLGDVTVQVLVDFPDNKSDFSLQRLETQEGKNLEQVSWADLVLELLLFVGVLSNQVVEDSLQALKLDGLNLNFLELLLW